MGIAHTPSMGFEFDKGIVDGFPPHWKPWYDGTRPVKDWFEKLAPGQIIIIYNDHMNQFGFDAYPTLAIGVADEFKQADESWGLRPFPSFKGDTDFGWDITTSLVHNEFDMTVCQELEIDHGIYSWMPYINELSWNTPILPIAVNMMRTPIPTSQRLWNLGLALKKAVEERDSDERVLIVSTGGMSHQIVGERFGIANEEFDRFFLSNLGPDPQRLMDIPQTEYMRLGGTEAAELSMWFSMRAALSENAKEIYSYNTFPKITGCGVITFEEPTT